jgi:hypothetical protein
VFGMRAELGIATALSRACLRTLNLFGDILRLSTRHMARVVLRTAMSGEYKSPWMSGVSTMIEKYELDVQQVADARKWMRHCKSQVATVENAAFVNALSPGSMSNIANGIIGRKNKKAARGIHTSLDQLLPHERGIARAWRVARLPLAVNLAKFNAELPVLCTICKLDGTRQTEEHVLMDGSVLTRERTQLVRRVRQICDDNDDLARSAEARGHWFSETVKGRDAILTTLMFLRERLKSKQRSTSPRTADDDFQRGVDQACAWFLCTAWKRVMATLTPEQLKALRRLIPDTYFVWLDDKSDCKYGGAPPWEEPEKPALRLIRPPRRDSLADSAPGNNAREPTQHKPTSIVAFTDGA